MDGATQVVSKLRAELQQLTIDHERLKARSAPCALPSAAAHGEYSRTLFTQRPYLRAPVRPPAHISAAATRPHLRLPRGRPTAACDLTGRRGRAEVPAWMERSGRVG